MNPQHFLSCSVMSVKTAAVISPPLNYLDNICTILTKGPTNTTLNNMVFLFVDKTALAYCCVIPFGRAQVMLCHVATRGCHWISALPDACLYWLSFCFCFVCFFVFFFSFLLSAYFTALQTPHPATMRFHAQWFCLGCSLDTLTSVMVCQFENNTFAVS